MTLSSLQAQARDFYPASHCRAALKRDKEKTGLPGLPIKGLVKIAK